MAGILYIFSESMLSFYCRVGNKEYFALEMRCI
ncbi:hypothetical protein FIU95_15180 [Microbulbifer sp. THAF38]|nr:hypothetical protein FIU95_15180 [Microbulbifer sp. THAF38]